MGKRIITGMPVRLREGQQVYSGVYFGSLNDKMSIFQIFGERDSNGVTSVQYREIKDSVLNLRRVSPYDPTSEGIIPFGESQRVYLPKGWESRRKTPGLEVVA